MENKFYIYFHINPLKNEVFYVGKGKRRRAYSKHGRNKWWKNIVNKYGYIVDIIESNLHEKESLKREIFYIKQIGRKDLGLGTLVNMTDGGDGVTNRIISEEEKIKRRGIKHTEEHKQKMSELFKGRTYSEESKLNMSNGRKGMKFSDEHKKKLSEAKKGKITWNKGITGELSHNFGKKRSQETKDKISKTRIERKIIHTEEVKKRISETKKTNKLKNK